MLALTSFALVELIFQTEIICDHGDEFGIGRFAAIVLNGVAEVAVEGIHVASVPRDLDGVTDGTLHAAGRD